MSKTPFLSARVIKESLPILQPPTAPGSPTLKRLKLPQGELAQFYDGDSGIRYIAYIELLPGSPRGNHYHNSKEEWTYLLTGELSLVVEDIVSKERASLTMSAGDIVRIPTGIAHTLQITSPGQAIEFSTARFDATDIHRYVLV
jgi:uncharacterized RmlC-like cupin family protein